MISVEDIITRSGHLPASGIAEEVNAAIDQHDAVIVTAPPGAGKSTLLPLTLLSRTDSGKILMLEPRRLAARQIAERMAHILGERVGETVGYRVRFEHKVSSATRIEVLTEGILTRMLIDDPTLDGVTAVIFDEFHERSIHADLALALTRQAQMLLRPDLRILIMSATIDATALSQTLHAPIIESQGRMFPVRIERLTHDPETDDMPRHVASAIRQAHQQHEGDILAFLPGQGEIVRCAELLEGAFPSTDICPLYGQLPPELQQRAIAPSEPEKRKIVLATPIAETSLTIEGVRIVIDSGFCRSLVFDGRTGLSHLETVRISMDMATQRSGRAGRVAEGICYRLWSMATEHRMLPQRKPEIEEADLAPLVLSVAAFGEPDILSLPWMTSPSASSIAKARQLLHLLGALDAKGCITALGQQMAALPCHPRIARMILQASSAASKALAADIAAILEEKDLMSVDTDGCDLSLRILSLRQARSRRKLGRWARVDQIATSYCSMVRVKTDDEPVSSEDVGALVAYAYPERLAQRQDAVGNYRLACGDNVRIEHADAMSAYPLLAVASVHTGGRVFLAAPVLLEDIRSLMSIRENVSWDNKQGQLLAQQERRLGKLLIDSKPLHGASKERMVEALCRAAAKDGLSMFSWNDDVAAFQRRIAQASLWHPDWQLPDLSTDHLLQTAAEWLPFYLDANGSLRTSASELRRIDMSAVLWSLIPYEQQQWIDRVAPSHVVVPTGSRIRIDYRAGAGAPVLSVRLQECFGMADTPRVDDGRQPLLMELLSPGFKPVQLTQDLQSFWQNTYYEVRKELRRRYPKHYWPDNPLEAEAVRGVRRKTTP